MSLTDPLPEVESQLLKASEIYPVWSPYDSYDAAATLLRVLDTGKDKNAYVSAIKKESKR